MTAKPEIQRYTDGNRQASDGRYVFFTDHQSAIASLTQQVEALRKEREMLLNALTQISKTNYDPECTGIAKAALQFTSDGEKG